MTDDLFDPDDAGISEEQTAEILHMKPETLATWRSQGRGPKYRKIGRHIEYTPRFIREYQASCVCTPAPASVRRQRRGAAGAGSQSTQRSEETAP
jgi:hypothetical protein